MESAGLSLRTRAAVGCGARSLRSDPHGRGVGLGRRFAQGGDGARGSPAVSGSELRSL